MTTAKGKASSRAKAQIKTKVTSPDPKEISIGIRNRGDTEICEKCQGSHYLLTNIDGHVHGGLCSCFKCPECGGSGHIYIEDEKGLSSLSECVCAGWVKQLKKLNEAGIPGKFLDATFESYNPKHQTQKKALNRAKDFVHDFSGSGTRGLLFMGRPGVGKTHLAVSVIKSLVLDKGADCKFVDFFQLLSDIRYGYSQNLSEQAIINPYVAAPVLVIDELAKGRNTEWELTMLDQIISARYNDSHKTTLITSNYVNEINQNSHLKKESSREEKIGPARYAPSPPLPESEPESEVTGDSKVDTDSQEYKKGWATGNESLQDKVGERIYSRLVEMCQLITLEGIDYRQEKN